jgi:hypothetical protein
MKENAMEFTALSEDTRRPVVDRFLSAVDWAMNSNTLLLKMATDVPVTAANRWHVLNAYLHSGLFEEMMFAAECDRRWNSPSNSYGERPLRREGFLLTLSPLDHAGFLARLRWMLCEAFSPYRHHQTEADADWLIRDFTQELLGEDGAAWSFASVRPDFLRSSGYFSDEEPLDPVYFDGGDSDTATFIHRDHTCYLLLTNGSP